MKEGLYFVYILFSVLRDRYYVGSCDDLTRRLADHSTYTRS